MTTPALKIGFIGLGTMGAPMAEHLIKAGHQLFVFTLGKMPDAIAASNATQCASGKGVADQADIIILMVPDRKLSTHTIALANRPHALTR